jgi:hypothetical protein
MISIPRQDFTYRAIDGAVRLLKCFVAASQFAAHLNAQFAFSAET